MIISHTTFKKKILYFLALSLGLLIPSLPYLYWESQQSFANTRNILDYLLIGQNRLYVPNSWKLFLFNYFPHYWSFVIGGYYPLALLLMITSPLVLAFAFLKKKLPTPILISALIFAALALLNRYYKGERSEGYLLYFLPLILLICSYTIYTLIAQQSLNRHTMLLRAIGTLLLITLVSGNIYYYYKNYLPYKGVTPYLMTGVRELIKKYPNTKFSVYDQGWNHSYHSQPLSFLLEREGKIDEKGMPIGFACKISTECEGYTQIATINGKPLLDLSKEDLSQNKWFNVNQKNLYDDLMRWSKTEKLKSNFTLFGK